MQRQQQAARQEALLGGVLEGAVGGLAAGQAPTQEQAAALEPALPGVSQAATAEAAGWQNKQDAILGLLKTKPILQRLKDMAGGSDLYRRLVVEEQRGAGMPEEQLKVWDKPESDAAVADWAALPDEDAPPHERALALLGYARQQLGGLPDELRPLALAELRRRGLAPAEATALNDIAAALADGRDIAALRRAKLWSVDAGPSVAPTATPGQLQLADSGESASDADPGAGTTDAPADAPPLSAEDAAWVAAAARQADETLADWSRRLGLMIADEGSDHDLATLQAVQAVILAALEHESSGDPDVGLMLAQGLAPDAW